MEKRLVRYGNSLVLVIDKSICRLLGIGLETCLELTSDGERIIIEPKGLACAKRGLRGASLKSRRIAVQRTFNELVEEGLIEDGWFARLSPMRVIGYRAAINRPGQVADARTMMTMDRLDVCHEAIELGMTWEQAVEAALAEIPEPDGVSAGRPR